MGAQGTTIVDFGAAYNNDTSVAVTGQAGILAGSLVEAWIWPVATTDHSVDEHVMASVMLDVEAGNIVAGTGFTIYLNDKTPGGSYGKWTVAWVWN